MARPGLTVDQLADELEQRWRDRRWVAKCAVPPHRGGCGWTAGPTDDEWGLFRLQERHMADEHPEVAFPALGICEEGLQNPF